ncbi:MAG: RNA polymerase sigma factor [Myxococcota bacterium]
MAVRRLQLVKPASAQEADVVSTLDDTALQRLACADDPRARTELYRRHHARVVRYACYLVRDRDLAEEVAQETFVRALDSLSRFRGEASFATWLDRIALNVSREVRRKRKGHRRMQEVLALRHELAETVSRLDQAHQDELRTRAMLAAIDTLPDSLREAFILRELLGFSPPEIAQRLGISKSNAAVRAHRARRVLAKTLRESGWLEKGGSP